MTQDEYTFNIKEENVYCHNIGRRGDVEALPLLLLAEIQKLQQRVDVLERKLQPDQQKEND